MAAEENNNNNPIDTPGFNLSKEEVSPISAGGTSSILYSKPVNFDSAKESGDAGGPYVPPVQPPTGAGNKTNGPDISADAYTEQAKEWGRNRLSKAVSNSIDEFKYQKAYSFNPEADGSRQYQNFQRYYQHSSYDKLGFSPWRDNEALYNEKGSGLGDLWRATKAATKLTVTGFVAPLRSYGDMFTGNPTQLDYKSADEMAQLNTVGASTRGGVTGFVSNLGVNVGYTVGVGSEIAAEFLLSGLLAPETGGASVGVTAVRTGNTLRNLFKVSTYTGKIAEGINYLKNFSAAKTAFNTINKVGKIVNPFEHTVAAIQAINESKNLTNLAKTSKTAAGFYRDVMMANAVASESKLEGASTYEDTKNKLLDEYYNAKGVAATGSDYEHILNVAHEAGATTMGYNIPTIFLTNKITFGSMFNKFANLEKYATKHGVQFAFQKGVGFDLAKPGVKTMVKGLLKPSTYGKASLNYLKGNFSEGLQESAQEVISGAAKEYYIDMYNNPSRQGMNYALADIRKSAADQFSGQGFETFASGFFMGGLLGAGGHVIRAGKEQALRLGDKATGTTKYADYKQLKENDAKQRVEKLNEIYKSPLKYFGSGIVGYTNATAGEKGKSDAQLQGDNKTWQDWEDQTTWGHLTNALDSGSYDVFLGQLKSISDMDADAIKEAYGADGEEVLSKISKIQQRAESLKDVYDGWKEKYPNPYNPQLYKEGTSERQTEELAYNSWNGARNIGIFYNHSYGRNKDRIKSMQSEIAADNSLADVKFSDLMPLMDVTSLQKEKKLLRSEISSLSGVADAEAVKQRKQSKRKLELLKSYEESLKEHFAVESVASQAQEGETLPVPNTQQKLKTSYESYVKYLTKKDQLSYHQADVNKAFGKIVDMHRLGIDNSNITSLVNHLENPGSFYEFQDKLNKVQTDMFNNRGQDIDKSVKAAQERVELNTVLQALFDRGIVIPHNQVDNLVTERKVPDEFYDVAGKRVITSQDPNYALYAQVVESYFAVNPKEPISDEAYKTFVDTGVVTPEVIKAIADKIKGRRDLSERETAIFHANTLRVNDLIASEGVGKQTAAGTIHIVRHGETIEDEKGINSGPTQEHITPEGAQHVKEGAEGNVDASLTHIVTSTRQRALDSADIIAKGQHISIEQNAALDPWNTGDETTGFAGIPDEDWHNLDAWFALNPDQRIYAGEDEALKTKYAGIQLAETFNEFKDRVLNGLPDIISSLPDGGAIVTHSNVIQLLKAYKENGSKNDAEMGPLFAQNKPTNNGEFMPMERRELDPTFGNPVIEGLGKNAEGKSVRIPQDQALAQIREQLSAVTDEDQLEGVVEEIESNIIKGHYVSDGVNDLIEARRRELADTLDFEFIKEGDVLIMQGVKAGDEPKRIVVQKDNSKMKLRRFGEITGGLITVYKKDLHRDVKYKYKEGMENQEAPQMGAAGKKLAETNKNKNTSFTSDPAELKRLAEEARKEGQEKVDNDFINDLGCK